MSVWFVVAIALSIMAIFLWAAYRVPIDVTKRFALKETDQAEVEDNFRKTFAQVLGGAALIATFSYTIFKDSETLDQAKKQFALQQFVEASKLLKESGAGTQAAGVYALEQVATIRSEFLDPVRNTLVTFIGSQAVPKAAKDDKDSLRPSAISAGTQAAIVVLARRDLSGKPEVLNFFQVYLTGAVFTIDESKVMSGFAGANFAGATLYGADMHQLDLTGAAFGGSHMADWEAYGSSWNDQVPLARDYMNERYKFTVNFNGSTLRKAGFDYVWMGGASFWRADLEEVHLYMNNLSRANFIEAKNLSKMTIDYATMPYACFNAVVADGMTIANSVATGADFGGGSFKGANLGYTDFTNASFKSAKLNGANLKGAKLHGADLSGADLSAAVFDSPDFSNATVRGTSFKGTNLGRANFANAVLSNVNFDGANLADVSFDGACVDGTVSSDRMANLPKCNLADLKVSKSACVTYGYKDPDQDR